MFSALFPQVGLHTKTGLVRTGVSCVLIASSCKGGQGTDSAVRNQLWRKESANLRTSSCDRDDCWFWVFVLVFELFIEEMCSDVSGVSTHPF